MVQNSRLAYQSQWGTIRHYCVYFGAEASAGSLNDTVLAILDGARQGHCFTLLLHRRQYADFRKMGWNGLHAGIDMRRISFLFPLQDLQRKIKALWIALPDLLAVRGCDGITFPGVDSAISKEELLRSITVRTTTVAMSPHSDTFNKELFS